MKTRQKRDSVIGDMELDMTSLIDCIFLLLIFFMVTTVFIDIQGLVIDLPGAADSSDEQQQKKDVNIQVTANGEYIVAGEPVSAGELAMAIRGAMDEFNNRNIIIHGDPETEHGFIVYAMDMATGQGAEQMAFAIEQAEEEQ
jgi:biopolymer transport protein ExbD